MIQDIRPNAFHIEYEERTPLKGETAYAMFFEGRKILLHKGEETEAPKLPLCHEIEAEYRYLFRVDENFFYLCLNPKSLPEDGVFEDINVFRRRTGDKFIDFAGIEAYHLANWYETNRFCGKCGSELTHSGYERALVCPNCNNTVYPKISPAIIVSVHDGDRLLMTRYAGRPQGSYSLVAGFVEVGEMPEDTVRREVMEETGVRVKNIRYYRSQPWGFSQSLLLGFTAELDGSPEITVDEKELAEAVWVKREDIAVRYDDFSLTNELITKFKNET